MDSNKEKALEAALTQIDRQFGKGTVMRLGDKERVKIPCISTGSLGLDVALGIGGLPRGRIVEIYGPESSGKTTLTLQVIAEAQKQGGTCAFVDAEHARKTLRWAKELGCNFVRLAHYPHNETMLRIADEMGLLVWAEIPVYWTVQFAKEQVYQNAENQLSEMISRDKNRASIILWSVANETPNHQVRFQFLEKLVSKARELDSSRLITSALDTQSGKNNLKVVDDPFAKIVDVIGVNQYCGWYSDKPEDCPAIRWQSHYKKPVIISEFGAGALYGHRGDENTRWTEEYQAAVYKHNLEMISKMEFVRGISPWILKDFRSPRRHLPKIQDFWNRKGVLSEKGERKLAWKVLRDYYENLTFKE